MAVVFNLIRDAMLTDEELQRRRNATRLLEGTSLTLRLTAAFVAVSGCPSSTSRALLELGFIYSLWESSVVLSNIHEIFTNAALELKVTLSKQALNAQLYKNAPVARLFLSS